jgi:threonine synthase
VLAVRGTYDDAFDLCFEVCEKRGWFNRNTGYNPYTREGKKTCSFELWEQLGESTPDRIIVPVGDGNIISGISIDWSRVEIEPVAATTVADSISVDLPRDGLAAVRAVIESGGEAVTVPDDDILAAVPEIARGAGVFVEPSCATTWACLGKMVAGARIDKNERVVCLLTGSGLKDIGAARRVAGEPTVIEPTVEAAEKALDL